MSTKLRELARKFVAGDVKEIGSEWMDLSEWLVDHYPPYADNNNEAIWDWILKEFAGHVSDEVARVIERCDYDSLKG